MKNPISPRIQTTDHGFEVTATHPLQDIIVVGASLRVNGLYLSSLAAGRSVSIETQSDHGRVIASWSLGEPRNPNARAGTRWPESSRISAELRRGPEETNFLAKEIEGSDHTRTENSFIDIGRHWSLVGPIGEVRMGPHIVNPDLDAVLPRGSRIGWRFIPRDYHEDEIHYQDYYRPDWEQPKIKDRGWHNADQAHIALHKLYYHFLSIRIRNAAK